VLRNRRPVDHARHRPSVPTLRGHGSPGFPARGDAGLTRRAHRTNELSAVGVRFSRSRKRYEREGLLVESAALAHAEQSRPGTD
jgi:hypothetical protein